MEEHFPSSGTDYGPGGHRYNDDLLLAQEARDRAQKEYPSVFHLLDNRELRDAFRPQNETANVAKRHAHVAGFWAVTLAFLALALAAGEPLWSHLAPPWPATIAITSAALGVLSIFVSGVWLIFGKRKTTWLHKRLFTERLRQFHFQAFVWRLPEMVQSLRDGTEFQHNYIKARNEWFEIVRDQLRVKGDAQMSALLHPTAAPPIWLHTHALAREPIVPGASVELQEIFRAYEVFRFDEQQGYSEFALRRTNNPDDTKKNKFPWWYPGIDQPIKRKRSILNAIWIGALVALLLVHIGVLITHILGLQTWEGPWTHVTIVWLALLAVAAKTLSEGFALSSEIDRYEEYRAIVSGLKQAFHATESPNTKVEIMMEMEKAAFEEMRAFLRSHHDATFIM